MSSHDDALAFLTNAMIERFALDPATCEIEVRDIAITHNGYGYTAWAQIRASIQGNPFPISRAVRARVWDRANVGPSLMWYSLDASNSLI